MRNFNCRKERQRDERHGRQGHCQTNGLRYAVGVSDSPADYRGLYHRGKRGVNKKESHARAFLTVNLAGGRFLRL